MGERQQDQLGDGHSFDQQKRAIGTEDAQGAFDLARQSSGKRPVTVLIKRRFSSAAIVSSEASQNHIAMTSTKAQISAKTLNTPRPISVPRSIALPFMPGERRNRFVHCPLYADPDTATSLWYSRLARLRNCAAGLARR
jgi:hypothetical protein